MTKKEEIVLIAADLIHRLGYHNLGIKRILEEADIPKGSFYYYFNSKEDLGLQVIAYHIENTKIMLSQVERSIDGIKEFFNVLFRRIKENDYQGGCPIGNLILELGDVNQNFRNKLLEWTKLLEEEFTAILKESKQELPLPPEKLASLLVATFEGIVMFAKIEKTATWEKLFNQYFFERILQ